MTPTSLRRVPLAAILAIIPLCLSLVHAGESPDLPKGIHNSLKPFVESHSLAGAVTIVADKNKVLDTSVVGFSDIKARTPMRPDALFWIASMSKPITATAVMILVDEGKILLDDPVEKYLPEFKQIWLAVEQDKEHILHKKPHHPITIREILSHTSGLPFASPLEVPTLDAHTISDRARSYAMTPMIFEPGTKYQYSNAGINTAGRIIEVVSGMPYEKFLDTCLFEPLGMVETTFWPSETQVARLAKMYKPTADKTNLEETPISQLSYPLTDHKRQPMPGGGLFSTTSDIARFCQMILNDGTFEGKRYLSETSIHEMTRRQTAETLKENYGLGWATGGDSFGHGGALSTNMSIDTKRGLITIFMVQHAGFPNDGNKSHGAFKKAAEEQCVALKK